MVIDAGRIKHLGDLMHKSIASNGSAVSSNWRLSADGLTNVVWTPETPSSVSYGSNSNEVTYNNAPGASSLVSRADHAHRGVTSLAHASNTYTGPVTLETEGGLYIVRSAANTYRLGSTGGGGGGGGGSTPTLVGARVYNNAAETIATGTGTFLTFNSERYDTDAFHSTVSNTDRLTVPTGKTGYYLITGHIEWAANATGERLLSIQLNGTTDLAIVRHNTDSVAASPTDQSISTVYFLSATDYVRMGTFQNSGGNLNINATGNTSPEFSISLLGT